MGMVLQQNFPPVFFLYDQEPNPGNKTYLGGYPTIPRSTVQGLDKYCTSDLWCYSVEEDLNR